MSVSTMPFGLSLWDLEGGGTLWLEMSFDKWNAADSWREEYTVDIVVIWAECIQQLATSGVFWRLAVCALSFLILLLKY